MLRLLLLLAVVSCEREPQGQAFAKTAKDSSKSRLVQSEPNSGL